MNLLYETLVASFAEKAKIERDAAQFVQVLRDAYPSCKLPVEKTISRFLNGETSSPQVTSLGFLAAYVLGKSEKEVSQAYQDGSLKEFYVEFTDNQPLSVATTEKNKKWLVYLLIVLGFVILFLSVYMFLRKPKPTAYIIPMMIPIKGGTFLMGDTFKETKETSDELPLSEVTIDDFEMGATEITFELFDAYCLYREIPLREDVGWGRGNRPAIMMDWYEAVDFCNWLSELKDYKSVYTIRLDVD